MAQGFRGRRFRLIPVAVTRHRQMKSISCSTLALCFLLGFSARAFAHAHHGPAFAIFSEQQAGSCRVSLWGHSEAGTSPFFVVLEPAPGHRIPGDLEIELAIEPVNGGLPQKHYATVPDSHHAALQYTSNVTLDPPGPWRVHVLLRSSEGAQQLSAVIVATPSGFGPWDLLLYAIPFLAVGLLWSSASIRRKRFLASNLSRKEVSCS
jgi:hypothetical protein